MERGVAQPRDQVDMADREETNGFLRRSWVSTDSELDYEDFVPLLTLNLSVDSDRMYSE